MLPEIGLIFDAGSSFYRVPDYLQTDEVQIVLSHAHLDHICGLTYFLPSLLSKRVKSAKVYGDQKTLSAVRTHLFSEEVFPILPSYEFVELPESLEVGQGGRVTHIPQEHPGTSLGFRVDWSHRSFAYLTDTHCDGSAEEFVQGVDVLIHESNFSDGHEELAKKTGHSTPSLVATMAKDADVGRLILTHLDPTLEGDDPLHLKILHKAFPNTEVAVDLMEIDL
jgi:ribonuclease BN (tRNA processing enzyme)